MTIENEKMIASSSSETCDISLGKKNSAQLPPQKKSITIGWNRYIHTLTKSKRLEIEKPIKDNQTKKQVGCNRLLTLITESQTKKWRKCT